MFIFFESTNLILGVVPETLGLFLFGFAMVIVAIGARWVLGEDRNAIETTSPEEDLIRNSVKEKDVVGELSLNER